MAKIGNNPTGDYLVELDTPDPCNMGRVRNDVPQAGRLNRIYEAIEILCGRTGTLEDRSGIIELVIDGGEIGVQAGFAGFLVFPAATMLITGWQLLVQPAGNIVLDLWKNNFGEGELTVANSIVITGKPETFEEVESRSTIEPDWDLDINPGDKLGINVDSVSGGIMKATLAISFTRTIV